MLVWVGIWFGCGLLFSFLGGVFDYFVDKRIYTGEEFITVFSIGILLGPLTFLVLVLSITIFLRRKNEDN